MPPTYKRVEYDKLRFYVIPELGNIKLPSSTTILSIINKPALVPWAARTTIEYLEPYLDQILKGKIKIEDLNINEILYGAKTAHAKIKKEAGNIGSIVHDIISEFHVMELTNKNHYYTIKECNKILANKVDKKITEFVKKVPDFTVPANLKNKVTACLSSFAEWREKVHFEVIESESTVFSAKYGYAGTLDALGKIYGETCIVDYKSSNGIWLEYYYQVASYRCAWEEMNKKSIPKEWIIRFGKEDGAFEARLLDDSICKYKDRLDGFFYARGLWNIQQVLESAEKMRQAKAKQSTKIEEMIPHGDIFGASGGRPAEGAVINNEKNESVSMEEKPVSPPASPLAIKTKKKKTKVLF